MLELHIIRYFLINNLYRNINYLTIIIYINLYKFKLIYLLFRKLKKNINPQLTTNKKIKYKKFKLKLFMLNLPIIVKYKNIKTVKRKKILIKSFNILKLNIWKKDINKYYNSFSKRLRYYLNFHINLIRYNSSRKYSNKSHLYKNFISFKKKKKLITYSSLTNNLTINQKFLNKTYDINNSFFFNNLKLSDFYDYKNIIENIRFKRKLHFIELYNYIYNVLNTKEFINDFVNKRKFFFENKLWYLVEDDWEGSSDIALHYSNAYQLNFKDILLAIGKYKKNLTYFYLFLFFLYESNIYILDYFSTGKYFLAANYYFTLTKTFNYRYSIFKWKTRQSFFKKKLMSIIKKKKRLRVLTKKKIKKKVKKQKRVNYIFRKFLKKNIINKFFFRAIYKNNNYLKFITLKNNITNKERKNNFYFSQRSLLYEKRVKNRIFNFFYKKKKLKIFYKQLKIKSLVKSITLKKKRLKNKFFNLNKSILAPLRRVRKLEWSLIFKSKLNKRRYKLFFNKEVKNIHKKFNTTIFLFFFLKIFWNTLSWQQLNLLVGYNIILINGSKFNSKCLYHGDLLETFFGFYIKILNIWYKLKYKKYLSRVKRWSYLNLKKKKYQKKKKYPVIIKKLPIEFKHLNHILIIDYSINTAVFNKLDTIFYKNYKEGLRISTIYKLYLWKFKP